MTNDSLPTEQKCSCVGGWPWHVCPVHNPAPPSSKDVVTACPCGALVMPGESCRACWDKAQTEYTQMTRAELERRLHEQRLQIELYRAHWEDACKQIGRPAPETKALPYLLSTYRSDDRVVIQCESVERADEALSRVMEWLHSQVKTSCDHSELLKKIPRAGADFVAEIQDLSRYELERRVLIQKDWLHGYSQCLDGLGLKIGLDKCRDPRDIRRIVEGLQGKKSGERPSKQSLTAIADSLAECARAYAGDTGLWHEHPLWAAIHAYENARATSDVSGDCIACSVGNPGVYIKDGRMVCPHRPEDPRPGDL